MISVVYASGAVHRHTRYGARGMRVDEAARARDLTQVKERVAELYDTHIRNTAGRRGASSRERQHDGGGEEMTARVGRILSGATSGGVNEEAHAVESKITPPPRPSKTSSMQAARGQAAREEEGVIIQVQNDYGFLDGFAARAVSRGRAGSESALQGEGQVGEEKMQIELSMLKHDVHHIASKFRQMEGDMSLMRKEMLQVRHGGVGRQRRQALRQTQRQTQRQLQRQKKRQRQR